MTALRITGLGAGGDGIAEDGTFVPFALPGEVVEAEAAGKGRAKALRWLTESPDRAAPPCPRFGPCGGCTLQHLAEPAYLAWKRGLLVEALERAGCADAPVAPLAVSPPNSRRRADLGVVRERDGTVRLGFHTRGGRELVDISPCRILRPELLHLLPRLAELLRGLQALRGEGSAVLNLLDTGPDLLLRTDAALTPRDRQLLGTLGLRRVAWALRDALPETAAMTEAPHMTFGGVAVTPPAGGFLQATAEGEAAITAAVLAGLPKPKKGMLVADLYAGAGTLSLPLAQHARVLAYEGSADAVAALDAASRKIGQRVKAEKRDLANRPLLARELDALDAAVLDPPYAGAAEQVAQIARSKLRRVIYVSCNPAALTRDLRVLRGAGFAVQAATPVDQFRWTAHLESVIALAR
ncbi:MAG: class I SAM-dependent RNA methyltransferase [Acetobacteraceae bacterium]|nr:class I SAM-dependent RNA methyltransferase [Acetobacteraceae bacterium]